MMFIRIASLASALLLPLSLQAASPALEMARQLNEAFIELADKASSSVVVIEVAHYPQAQSFHGSNPLFDFLPPDLRERLRQEPKKPARREPVFDGRGSGVVIREDGFILTNTHVVEEAAKIRVRLKDGREYEAKTHGVDPLSDVAVIKIEAEKLPTAQLGDSQKVRVGEMAVAIGAPFDLDYSVTFGHVSAKGRSYVIPNLGPGSLGEKMDQDFIQTDASINPGNSGGPLINMYGEVIGINTLIRGLNTGIGFAIPINLAKDVSDQLISQGKFSRAWLGVRVRSVKDYPEYREMFPDVKSGVVVAQIDPTGPAAKSELRASDVILSVEGTPVSNAIELRNAVRAHKVGSALTLEIARDGKNKTIEVKTDEWPESAELAEAEHRAEAGKSKPLGLTVQELTEELAKQFEIEESEGLIVTDVEPDSAADEKGIEPGDIITEIDHRPVKTVKEFREAVEKAGDRGIILNLISDGAPKFEILKKQEE